MTDEIFNLFASIDKLCGGDGDPARIHSELRKIEKRRLFTLKAIWKRHDCHKCNFEARKGIAEFIVEAKKLADPDDLCGVCVAFRDFFDDKISNFLYVYDLEKKVSILINGEITDCLGYTPEQIRQMGDEMWDQMFHPDEIPTIDQHHTNLRTTKERCMELTYRIKDASSKWRLVHGIDAPLQRNNDGTVRLVVGAGVVAEYIPSQ